VKIRWGSWFRGSCSKCKAKKVPVRKLGSSQICMACAEAIIEAREGAPAPIEEPREAVA
jgi:hypothetical protein